MLAFQLNQRGRSLRSLYRPFSILGIAILAVSTAAAQAAQTITVHCGKTDSAVTHVTYKRGVDHPFYLDNSPSAIIGAVTTDVQNGISTF